jgi:hypothetical protein
MAARWERNVQFCMPNKTKRILLVSAMATDAVLALPRPRRRLALASAQQRPCQGTRQAAHRRDARHSHRHGTGATATPPPFGLRRIWRIRCHGAGAYSQLVLFGVQNRAFQCPMVAAVPTKRSTARRICSTARDAPVKPIG